MIARTALVLSVIAILTGWVAGCRASQASRQASSQASSQGDATASPTRPLTLRCSLTRVEPAAPSRPVGSRLRLRWELRNESAFAVSVLSWQTPLEGFRGPLFEVTRDGAEVAYLGPVVKRGDPGAGDYVRVPGGGAVSREVELAEAYELAAPGRYRIAFPGGLFDVAPDGAELPRTRDRLEPVGLECPVVEVELS